MTKILVFKKNQKKMKMDGEKDNNEKSSNNDNYTNNGKYHISGGNIKTKKFIETTIARDILFAFAVSMKRIEQKTLELKDAHEITNELNDLCNKTCQEIDKLKQEFRIKINATKNELLKLRETQNSFININDEYEREFIQYEQEIIDLNNKYKQEIIDLKSKTYSDVYYNIIVSIAVLSIMFYLLFIEKK